MQHPEEAEDGAWIYTGQVAIPPTVRRVKVAENIKKIPVGAFKRHLHLEEVTISSSVQVIGKEAFSGCWNLKSILYQGIEKEEVGIPSNVKVIDDFAFSGCSRLELVLNEGLERIGEHAFSCCESLSNVRIPQSVSTLGTDAFLCSNLISIELPEECSFTFDLRGCICLSSLAGRISIYFYDGDQEEEDIEESFRSTKLGCLVDNEADLIRRLNHRFHNSPLNKLCYYQSYHSYENAMAQLRSLMEDDPLAATTQVDEFGMTPLHILSLSQTLNVDMLLAVMQAGQLDHIIFCKDSFESTPMDYLCLNGRFESTPMDYLCLNGMTNSTEVVRKVLLKRFEELLGLDRSLKSELLQAIDEALKVDWQSRRREIVSVYLKLANFERNEIVSVIESFLWKTKEQIREGRAVKKSKVTLSDEIKHVLSFCDNLDVEAYFASYPDMFQSPDEEEED
eukprot:scaffold8194_cov118-Cylindrotheca_fusiformis.AAC.14